jgi:DNA-binding LytR/AlgR family response regulator
MIKIAIVEDEKEYANQLVEYLKRFEKESNHEFQITQFSDGDEIVENYKAQFDIILMDIQMQFMDGMTAAEQIRKQDPEVVIIFITNMTQYAIRGYAVDALDYILKPVSYFAFSQRLSRAIDRMRKHIKAYITISIKGGAQKIDIDEIFYIESNGHNLEFNTITGKYVTVGTMKEVEERLLSQGFFRCNKGYLVNLEYVEGIREGCAVVHGNQLLISRARRNDFMKALTEYIGSNIR